MHQLITDATTAQIDAYDFQGLNLLLNVRALNTPPSSAGFYVDQTALGSNSLSSFVISRINSEISGIVVNRYLDPQTQTEHLRFSHPTDNVQVYKVIADQESLWRNLIYTLFLTENIQTIDAEYVVSGVLVADPIDPDPTDPEENMSALQALQQIWDQTQSFYGVCFVDELSAEEMQAVTDWCQSHYRLPFFVVTDSAYAIAATTAINQLNYYTHVTTYHQSHDEVGAIMGMALDQKFDQPNGIKTLKFKTLVGTPPTLIGETLAGQLDAAGVNYYTNYGNPDAPVLMYSQGFAGAGKFADFVMGLHWLRNDAQVEVFNTFRINPKVNQTEGGMSVLKAGVARSCMRGVDNGLIAGGQWNGQPLGTVNTGDFLPTGYYIYADKIRNQTQQVRETRQAQPISVLVKGAGALHGADISFIGEQ